MQTSEFLLGYGIVIGIQIILLVGFTILRWMAVKQYRLVRAGERGESTLSSLGDRVSNTRMHLFDSICLIIFILGVSQGLTYLNIAIGFDVFLIPLTILSVGLLLVFIVFLKFTIRGQAYQRTERILADHQTLGHEDWIIRKHLAELVHQSEDDDNYQAEIAKATLEKLKQQQNRTGDAVRQILENPDQLRDIERMKKLPSTWRSFRFSLLILVGLVALALYFGIGFMEGFIPYYDLYLKALTFILLSTLVFVSCLCVESSKARSNRRKTLFGV